MTDNKGKKNIWDNIILRNNFICRNVAKYPVRVPFSLFPHTPLYPFIFIRTYVRLVVLQIFFRPYPVIAHPGIVCGSSSETIIDPVLLRLRIKIVKQMINGEDMRFMRLEQKRQMNGIFCVFIVVDQNRVGGKIK